MDACTPTLVPFLARAITENSILTILRFGGFLNDFATDWTALQRECEAVLDIVFFFISYHQFLF